MPESWSAGTLGDLTDDEAGIKSGPFGTVLSAAEYGTEGVPVISVGEVGYGEFRLRSETPRVSEAVTSRLAEYLLREGDIVFGRKGAVDRSAWVSSREAGWFLGSDGLRVRINSGADSRFVAFQLRGEPVRNWLLQHAGGSTLLSLNQGTLARVPVVIPPLADQQAIAEVLGALDDKITTNTALAANCWAIAESEHSFIQREDEVRRVALGAVAILEYGKSLPATARIDGSVLVVGSGGVSGTHNRALVEQSGVVVGRKGSAGSVIWVSGPHYPIDTTFFVRGTHEVYSQPYLYFLLRTLRLDEMNNDSAVPGLNRTEALATPVYVPSETSIERFTTRATALISMIDAVNGETRTLAATRDALLPQLMSGKLRVRDAERIADEAGV